MSMFSQVAMVQRRPSLIYLFDHSKANRKVTCNLHSEIPMYAYSYLDLQPVYNI